MSKINDVITFSLDKLKENVNGIRYGDLYRMINNNFPDMKSGTITGTIRNFYLKNQDKVYKPEKGLFRLNEYKDSTLIGNNPASSTLATKIHEEDFYESFAEWLIDEVEECTKSIKLGGNIFGGKWETPDVIGVLKPGPTDIIKNEIEITSAEIKLDVNQLITAFGQACSYKLFSHRVYLVIPKQSNQDEISRLDSLCALFGIGLVLYDSTKPDEPDYQIKNRAQKGIPDNFYVNKNLTLIANQLLT